MCRSAEAMNAAMSGGTGGAPDDAPDDAATRPETCVCHDPRVASSKLCTHRVRAPF
jgi:hypothetical protein